MHPTSKTHELEVIYLFTNNFHGDFIWLIYVLITQSKTIAFTGTLKNNSMRQAEKKARKVGATVTSDVTSDTHLLVVGLDPGKKKEEAEKLGESRTASN